MRCACLGNYEWQPSTFIDPRDFTAGGKDKSSAKSLGVLQEPCNQGTRILRATGTIIDRIQHCSASNEIEELMQWREKVFGRDRISCKPEDMEAFHIGDGRASIQFAQQGWALAFETLPAQDDEFEWLDAFLETCIQADSKFYQEDCPAAHFLRLGFLCFARIMGMPPKLRVSLSRWIDGLHGDFRPKDETAMENAFFTKVISSPGPRRRFCVTERGLFGLFPAGCQPGDDVFILKGGAVPFVLRPVGIPSSGGTDEQTYRLIGDAYIRGIMYGEALSFEGIRELNAHII